MLNKILITLGDDSDAAKILEHGLTVAAKFNAEVMLLHVLNPLQSHGFNVADSPLLGGILPIVNDEAIKKYTEEWQIYEKKSMERLQSYQQQAIDRGLKTQILQNFGDLAPMICAAAKEWSADLIVIGRNQKPNLSEIFLGSTSSYVLHHASCSVFTVQLPN
jgi:nucleotide-binding universal stress UspA family protein